MRTAGRSTSQRWRCRWDRRRQPSARRSLPRRSCAPATTPPSRRPPLPGRLARRPLPITPPFSPMLAKLATEIPTGDGWHYEPKWDGFRCIVFRDGDSIELASRNERPLTRYFPELLAPLSRDLPER